MAKWFVGIDYDEHRHYLSDQPILPTYAVGTIELTDAELADLKRVEAEYDSWQERLESASENHAG